MCLDAAVDSVLRLDYLAVHLDQQKWGCEWYASAIWEDEWVRILDTVKRSACICVRDGVNLLPIEHG